MKLLSRTPLALAAVALTALGLSACTTNAAQPEPLTAEDVTGVWGTPDTQGEPVVELQADGSFSGNDGCNVIGGSWEIDEEGALAFGPIHATMMYCEGVDEWLLEASSAEVQGDSMVFSDESGEQIGTLERHA